MILDSAKSQALQMLGDTPKGAELSIAGVEDQEIWLGMGYCVGKGLATYRGSYCFQITDSGRSMLALGE